MPKASSHFWWLPTSLSVVLSTLGILALAKHAFVTWSLSAPLELVMAAYNSTMQLLLGWAHPYLQAALTWLGSFIGWRPTLYPHWRDVFVVLSLIGIGLGRVYWLAGTRNASALARPALFAAVFGAAVTALAAGMLPLQTRDLMTQLLIAASVGLAVLPFLIPFRLRDRKIRLLGLTWEDQLFAAIAIALAALVTWLLSLVVGSAAGLGLAGIASVVVLFGLVLLVAGWAAVRRSRLVVAGGLRPAAGLGLRPPPELRAAALAQEEENGKFWLLWGLTILGGFVGALCVFAVDAGLKLLGA